MAELRKLLRERSSGGGSVITEEVVDAVRDMVMRGRQVDEGVLRPLLSSMEKNGKIAW